MQITVTHDDGSTADITEGVQIAYDIAYGSMDWGSGFLDLDEMEAVARLAEACRFPSFSDALDSVAAPRREQEEAQARRDEAARKRREQDDLIRRERQGTAQAQRLAEIRYAQAIAEGRPYIP